MKLPQTISESEIFNVSHTSIITYKTMHSFNTTANQPEQS